MKTLLASMRGQWEDMTCDQDLPDGRRRLTSLRRGYRRPVRAAARTARTAKPARRSRASCGTGGCCSSPARAALPIFSSGRCTTASCRAFHSTANHSSTRIRCSRGAASDATAGIPVACCPPNIMRMLASLHHYLATVTDSGVQLHQYASSTIQHGRPRRRTGRADRRNGLSVVGHDRGGGRVEPRCRLDAVAANSVVGSRGDHRRRAGRRRRLRRAHPALVRR